uniref:PGG domain-containing protein n=1 Tax=Arundo donax TaxID=35708 RepID=A0A0A9EPK7_ARUDO
MAPGVQPQPAIAPNDTTTTPGPGNGENEDIHTHGDNMVTGSGSSNPNSVDDSVDSTKDDFELLWRLRKYLVLLGILAVSVTYNSGLTPPGGFWNKNKDGHEAGDPALRVEFSQRYEVFFYCNATAFAASLVLIILLLSQSVTRQKLWLRSMQFTMIVDLFSLLGTYAAGSCRALKSSIYIWILVFGVFVYVGIHSLVSTRIVPKSLKEKVKTVVNRILSKFGEGDGPTSSLEEKKDLEVARKFILMLVTFAATVTYQAGLSPPGGFWAENDYLSGSSPPYKHRPATSVLRSHYLRRYNIFVSCNSTSFVASLVTILLLLSPELSVHGIRSKAVVFCVVADLFCLIGAYAAGCCRDVATSFYVVFIIVIVLICIAFLAGIFVCKPVAERLRRIKSGTARCMSVLLSSKFGSTRSSSADQESSHKSHHQDSVHATVAPAEDSACEPELQYAGNQQVSNTMEGDSCGEYPPEDNQKTENTESFSNSRHPSAKSPQSANTKDLGSNLEHESTDCQLVANTNESLANTEHPSLSCQERDGISDDSQQDSGMKEQSSTDDIRTTDIPAEGSSEQNMLAGDYNGTTNVLIEDERHSLPAEASGNVESAEEHTSSGHNNRDIENGGVNNNAEHENGRMDSNQGALYQNSHGNSTEEHLEKTRTYLLLLAILAISLTYQSGLNPPGGFWSRSENNHSAGDRILEDTNHPRFIAFFYLNAVAFVASIVMILMLLNKSMSKKVTKRRELQITMIVDLLSLTGAFVMGSCREAKKSISISVILCIVLAYVVLHVRIAIHVIPPECKKLVSEKLKNLSCGNVWSALPQLCHKQTVNETSPKELERRRNLLLTVAILAATVTYQAGINPPGGVWSDDKDVSGTPGNPILQDSHRKRYDVFYYSNSLSFVSSVVITILLVNKESCEHGIKSYALRVCLVVGLLGLLIAYAAGSCRNRKQSIFLIIIAVAVLIALVIQVLLSSMHETLGRPLAQFMESLQQLMECLQRWVSGTEKVRGETTSKSTETKDCDEKTVRKRHKYLMLIATLAASITYQAGLNPPGGFWSDDKNGHFSGDPLLHDINHRRYKTFFCFNAISFMASIVVIMLLLSKSVRKKDVPLEVLLLIMILDLLALMTAFAAGSCRKLKTSVYVFVLFAGVVIYLVILIVLSRAIVKILKKWKRSGILCSRHPERVSRTSTQVQTELV